MCASLRQHKEARLGPTRAIFLETIGHHGNQARKEPQPERQKWSRTQEGRAWAEKPSLYMNRGLRGK